MFLSIGKIICRLLKVEIREKYPRVFLQLVLGGVVFVLLNSVIFTLGQTVNLGFIVIFTAFYISIKSDKSVYQSSNIYHEVRTDAYLYLELIAVSLVIFLFNLSGLYNGELFPKMPHGDYVYYANLTNYLINLGVENASVNYIFKTGTGVSPYNYFQVWMNVGLVSLFKLNTLFSLMLVNYTIGPTIIWIGFCSIFTHFLNIRHHHKIFAIGFLFLTGALLSIYLRVGFMAHIETFIKHVFNYHKLYPIYWFLIGSVIFFLKHKIVSAFLTFLCIPITFISTIFGVFPAIIGYAGVQWIIKKEPSYRLVLISAIFLAVFFGAFYILQQNQTGTHIPSSEQMIDRLLEFSSLITSINIFGGTVIQIFLLAAPFLFLLIVCLSYSDKSKFKPLLRDMIFPGLIFFFSLLSWSVFHFTVSSVQLFSNLTITMLNILIALICVWSFTFKRPIIKVICLFLLFSVATKNLLNSQDSYASSLPYSQKYLSEIQKLAPQLSLSGSFMISKKDYEAIHFSYISHFYVLGKYLLFFDYKGFPNSISPHDYTLSADPRIRNIEETTLAISPFIQFVEKQKVDNVFQDIQQSRVDFLIQHEINYLIATKATKFNSRLESLVRRSIIDENTGERFLLLNVPGREVN